MKEYTKADLSGVLGSTDAVNIVMDRRYWRLYQEHLGYKQSSIARTYILSLIVISLFVHYFHFHTHKSAQLFYH